MSRPAAGIKAVALDVDGVLTDGTFWWGGGEELKRFSFLDIMGVSLGRKAGLVFALISGEDSPLVDRYAAKMGIADVFKGCTDKGAALREFAGRHGFALTEVAFMGDDVNDLPALALAGLAAAPASAHEAVLGVVAFVTKNRGGRGAVRELVDMVLSARRGAGQTPPVGHLTIPSSPLSGGGSRGVPERTAKDFEEPPPAPPLQGGEPCETPGTEGPG